MVIDEAGGSAVGGDGHNRPGNDGLQGFQALRMNDLTVLEPEKGEVPNLSAKNRHELRP